MSGAAGDAPTAALVQHRRITVAGIETFYREAGRRGAPVLLLPHGYPCSSYEFRNLMPRLADRWRLIAPDFPGAGYSGTPDDFNYSFDGYATWLEALVDVLEIDRFALYLHDFGSPTGARLAIKDPRRIVALIIQNGDIPYEDALGPKYADIEATWSLPRSEMRKVLAEAISEATFKEEFLNDLPQPLDAAVPPDLWTLHWSLMTPQRKEIAIDLIAGLKENRAWFPQHRKYLRENRPPALIVWGPNDHYMPEQSARAYLHDLPDAELHLLGGGHWLLETHLEEVTALMRDFLGRVHPS
ncbi:alpha/beta fold hydrolase [Rhizobium sp. BT03]|uniref:alpha/beta fold hydrolase n=1 Tax=Rhizobium sp. BT03 TaxID=3045156 RepID=UPI0024B3CFDF|nr:alpha/beta hydrolase [Rhizobium sp. BT03]WHO76180.1 alpha/beta hydrolase [Rhizobium sp. BT03]